MIKVVKFGGSSLASAEQFAKVGKIIHADKERRYVVPSAPGKRNSKDTKVTDMLYACYDLVEKDEDCITIVDSENVCLGEQILVMYACRLRDAGASASEIAKALDQKKKDVRVLALLDTLEYLKRGGRISKTAALAGNLLSIKPVIAIVDGEVAVLGKARGSKNGCNMLREEIAKCNGIDFSMPLCLGYTGLEDSLLQKYIEDNTDLWKSYVEELPISSIGSTIGTHTGPGGICVAFFSKTNS